MPGKAFRLQNSTMGFLTDLSLPHHLILVLERQMASAFSTIEQWNRGCSHFGYCGAKPSCG
jgi:hypothetical protein